MKLLNRSRQNIFLLACLALLVALLPASATAQPRGPRGHGPFMGHRPLMAHGMHFERIAERLDLTPEQQDAIRDVRGSFREELKLELQQLRSADRALREQIHSETFDEAVIRDLAGTLAEATADAAVTRAQMAQEVRGILTPEQRQEIRGWIEKRQLMMEERATRFRERFSEIEQ